MVYIASKIHYNGKFLFPNYYILKEIVLNLNQS